jgi:protein tyrosine phosphatase (PTP) superfamily phosphohydrolase (DUF442 family)
MASRPAYWARPVPSPGIANLYQVSPSLYRGGEPMRIGAEQLARLGVRSVINLRTLHDSSDRLDGLGMNYHTIAIKAWAPAEEEIVEFLRITSNPTGGPYFVHCYTGGDRVGLVVAAYRIAVQGWSKDEAILEMRYGGFTYHAMFDKWYLPFLQNLDVAEVRRLAGIRPPPRPMRQANASIQAHRSVP